MQNENAKPVLSEKGLFTRNNWVLIDLQPQMLFGVSIFDRQSVISVDVARVKEAQIFDVPRPIDETSRAPFLRFASIFKRNSK